jgi:V/A-type H+/Na+-transporting ATPase subunit D
MASRMPESQREITATRIALLELKDERQLVREGYELLDEKRILLATEIRRQLTQLVALRRDSAELASDLRSRTVAAVGRHGMDELSVYPPLTLASDRLTMRRSRLFGLELLTAHLEPPAQPPGIREPPVNPTPEARACADAHRRWLVRAVELAACCVNLRRLARDYVRTERRARAIENVLMPEIESTLKIIDEQLEGMDQEEIARLRQRRIDPLGT